MAIESKAVDIMIDLETTGIRAGCCILSLGASSLDESEQFYRQISHQSCINAGLKDLPATMAWWNKQSAEARMEAFTGELLLIDALGQFADFIRGIERTGKVVYVWGNGADFDLPILAAAFDTMNIPVPWKAYNGRCYRTVKNLWPDVVADKFEGVKHNALADAIFQARHLLKIMKHRKLVNSNNRPG